MTRTESLYKQVAQHEGFVQRLRQQHASQALALADAPDDAGLHKDLEALEKEIDAEEKTIRRLQSALSAAERADSAELTEKEQQHKAQAGSSALRNASARIEVAAKLDCAWDEVILCLEEMSALREKIVPSARAAIPAKSHASFNFELGEIERHLITKIRKSPVFHALRFLNNVYGYGGDPQGEISARSVAASQRDKLSALLGAQED